MEETVGKRDRLDIRGGNAYLFTAPDAIMITVPDENDPKNRDERAYLEAICRVGEKALKAGLPMQDIVNPLRKSGVGRNPVLVQIADVLERDYCRG